jgi:phosphate starvation-inducible protein PhoH and related proteins
MSQSQDYVPVSARTEGQKRLVESIHVSPITICTAPAGSGKTLLTLFEAIQFQKQQLVRDIIFCRPIVEFESLKSTGFLPGTSQEKLVPLLYPIIDNLQVFCSAGFMKYVIDKQKVEPMLIQDLRGRSLNDTFLIVDEAQNLEPKIVELVLTRLGSRSKIVLLGDTRQVDLRSRFVSGLEDAKRKLRGLSGVGIVEMSYADVVRGDGLCGEIQKRYAN